MKNTCRSAALEESNGMLEREGAGRAFHPHKPILKVILEV